MICTTKGSEKRCMNREMALVECKTDSLPLIGKQKTSWCFVTPTRNAIFCSVCQWYPCRSSNSFEWPKRGPMSFSSSFSNRKDPQRSSRKKKTIMYRVYDTIEYLCPWVMAMSFMTKSCLHRDFLFHHQVLLENLLCLFSQTWICDKHYNSMIWRMRQYELMPEEFISMPKFKFPSTGRMRKFLALKPSCSFKRCFRCIYIHSDLSMSGFKKS